MYRSLSRLWLLPDVGMDARLLQPQANHFSNCESPTLPRFSRDESLAQFAARSADSWIADSAMAEHLKGRCFLGGVGFGGLVALELAFALANRSIQPAGVFLIASARSDVNISSRSRLKLSVMLRLPSLIARWRMASRFQSLAKTESLNEAHRRMLRDMAQVIDWEQVRWQLQAMLDWKRGRSDRDSGRFPIYQIHGRADRVFRVPAVEDATILIHGKHLISLSHSGEVNRWIESILRDDELRQTHQQCSK